MVSSHSKDKHYQTYHFEDPELDATIHSTATLNIDILLHGETGTGKDTLAEQLHYLSERRGHYVALNCAANYLVSLKGHSPAHCNHALVL